MQDQPRARNACVCSNEPCDFIAARHAVIAVGRKLTPRMLEQVNVEWWKEERGRDVLIDFSQIAGDRWVNWVLASLVNTALLWWQRDLANGMGVLPDPPEYPKMPGEPLRVKPTWARHE